MPDNYKKKDKKKGNSNKEKEIEEHRNIISDCPKIEIENDQQPLCGTECVSSSSSTLIDCVCALPRKIKRSPPNIQQELNSAKSILQQCSSLTGDNVFDHLSDLIRRIIDQKPINVIDYFEEFSRNVREQKFHTIENFMEKIYEGPKSLWTAECILSSLNLLDEVGLSGEGEEQEEEGKEYPVLLPITMDEGILELQLRWSLCGFGIELEEGFQLACCMQKLMLNPKLATVRFWGKVFGLNKSYYIAECDLTALEIERRKGLMQDKLKSQRDEYIVRQANGGTFLGDPKMLNSLIPGYKWKHYHPQEELDMIKKEAAKKLYPTPLPEFIEKFNTPPELVGHGLNRKVYYAVNSLTETWRELPVVTPRQIDVSRKIKKFFTGDLDQQIVSYPDFPGVEKHYLRAMIARITASTYIAPKGYYRLQTKKDLRGDDEGEEEEEEEEEEDECTEEPCEKKFKTRDPVLMKNEKYVPLSIVDLITSHAWVHIRPSILPQGRVEYINVEDYLNKRDNEEMEEEEEEEEEDDGEEKPIKEEETGPPIFSKCEDDTSSELTTPWSVRISALRNRINQIAIVKSNIWPGAYSFSHGKYCDNIYFGWGQKYVARNYTPQHVPQIQNECPFDTIETIDPTPQMEEEWRLAHLPPAKDMERDAEENIEEEFEE